MDPFLTLALFTAAKPRRSRSSQPKARGALVASGVGQGCLESVCHQGLLGDKGNSVLQWRSCSWLPSRYLLSQGNRIERAGSQKGASLLIGDESVIQHTLICKLKAVYFGDGGGVENLLKTKQMSFNIHNLKIISKKTKDK